MLASEATADCVKPWDFPIGGLRTAARPTNSIATRGTAQPRAIDVASAGSRRRTTRLRATCCRVTTACIVRLYVGGNGNQAIEPGFFQPVVIDPGTSAPTVIRTRSKAASPRRSGQEPFCSLSRDSMVGPTGHGFEALIDQDPGARWDPLANGGLGAPTGGCMAAATCSRSPRWIAVPVFNIDTYEQARTGAAPGRRRTKQSHRRCSDHRLVAR